MVSYLLLAWVIFLTAFRIISRDASPEGTLKEGKGEKVEEELGRVRNPCPQDREPLCSNRRPQLIKF